ncbi:BofC C-terminal domain-containing protein [Paenibacillus yanchengensis]|uniref:BofC C-terminal domain-containing protein n=1 Tax=Paenibacillus yanchengensis TaxID=2035833 RepID=A0ABW4YLT8_9BACL
MMLTSWWKQLKRRWRRNKLSFWIVAIVGLMIAFTPLSRVSTVSAASKEHDAAIENQALDDQSLSTMMSGKKISIEKLNDMTEPLPVYFQQIYACGEDQQLLGTMEPKEIAEVVIGHPDWTIFFNEQKQVAIVRSYVDDLSNYCKSNAYFGLDRNGNFSLFDGLPDQEKIMRTFFQIDVQYMESNLPQERITELTKGIPVTDIEEFNSVLETFSDFAMERNSQEDY